MADFEKANHISTRKKGADTRTTEDATENNNVMVKDAVWYIGATSTAAERKLQRKMEEIFINWLGKQEPQTVVRCSETSYHWFRCWKSARDGV